MKALFYIGAIGMLVFQSHAQPLQKVINYPGLSYETHWNFNTAGQLTDIRKPDNTIMQDFTYDAAGNLTVRHVYLTFTGIGSGSTQTFSYDGSNRISSYNGNPVTFNPVDNRYTYSSGDVTYAITVNAEGLFVSESYVWVSGSDTESDDGLFVSYSNGNVAHTYEDDMWEGHWQHVTVTNPLKAQLMPILKALVITNFDSASEKWTAPEYASGLMVSDEHYDWSAPESNDYYYQLNADGKPQVKYRRTYYFDAMEWEGVAALYYYLGDILP